MTDETTGLFWERQPDESATAYQAFCTYRDMGLTRSLRKAAEVFYADREDDEGGYQGTTERLPGPAQIQRFKEWSRQNLWQSRVEAFDAEEARKRSVWLEQERIRMTENLIALARQGESVAAKKLFDIARGEADLPGGALPALMEKSANIHTRAVGEPTERLEVRQDLNGRRDPALSHLTDDEVEQLADLVERLPRSPQTHALLQAVVEDLREGREGRG